ncbi:hypothetical protein BKA23_0690 [Rudaeicoccus suwonensis]|uniref:Uncharacterized protein n=1 Tax=Rudaeicoccus suwonensis TaxID=657409 RepID=A0A561E8G1_9MICO|nr:hypothetical protein BKA23_0690 [Rudaeicoccus suwonensis]
MRDQLAAEAEPLGLTDTGSQGPPVGVVRGGPVRVGALGDGFEVEPVGEGLLDEPPLGDGLGHFDEVGPVGSVDDGADDERRAVGAVLTPVVAVGIPGSTRWLESGACGIVGTTLVPGSPTCVDIGDGTDDDEPTALGSTCGEVMPRLRATCPKTGTLAPVTAAATPEIDSVPTTIAVVAANRKPPRRARA